MAVRDVLQLVLLGQKKKLPKSLCLPVLVILAVDGPGAQLLGLEVLVYPATGRAWHLLLSTARGL